MKQPTQPEKPLRSFESAEDLKGITVEEAAELDEEELEQIVDKKKSRPKRRKFESGIMKWLILILTITMSAYHLFTAVYSISPLAQRAAHLLFVLVLVFLLYPATRRSPKHRPSIVDLGLVLASIVSVGNLLVRFETLAKSGGRGNSLDIFFGVITVLLVLECARRTVGLILPSLAIFMIVYGFYGNYVPGIMKHPGFSLKRIVQHLTLTTEGVYGQILGVSSTFIYMFILFGAFLGVTGMSAVFNDVAVALAGGTRGGPAKVSVIASGLMGSISGSASANVVTTGAFTIPLMSKLGYKDYFASAVEAASSTGGQIMPPVMGSAAFIIADSLGLPFAKVIRAAFIPAVLYYFSIWHMVDLRARKENIAGMKKEDLPNLKEVLLSRGHLLIPLVGVIVMLLIGYNPMRAAVVGIILSIISSSLKRSTRINLRSLIKAMESGALNALPVAAACAVIGNLLGIASLTGAILKLGAAVVKLGGGILILTLILTMLSATVLGMGLPTTAVYILASTVAAPALVRLGVVPLAAHLFVFYYGILSAITPPVCNAAYTAAGLSGANPNRTGLAAVRLAIAGWIVPFMFVYCNELLLPDGLNILVVLRVFVTALIGILGLGWAVEGHIWRKLNIIERLLCGGAALLLINSSLITDLAGCGLLLVVYLRNWKYRPVKISES